VGQRRCPVCGLFCRALGLGGACPHCDELVLLTELLEPEVLTAASRTPGVSPIK
jgi:hypothetical protein